MLVLFWVLLFLVGSCLVLLVPALWGKQIYDTYRGTRTVNCPETHAPVKVRFNAMRAAITGLSGKPRLGLTDCSRWPVHADCRQECIPDAELVSADALKPAAPSQAKRFFHLPVLVGAGVAWVFGMAWHSQYAFRPRWMHALGLSDAQALDLARMWTPHLLTVAACLIFAYGVASLMAWTGERSMFRGIQVALSLWLVVVAALMIVARPDLATELIWIEGVYTFLAALLMGAIVGGAHPRQLIRDSE